MGDTHNRNIAELEMEYIYREALDFAGIGLYRYKFDGTIVFMDRGALRLLDLEEKYANPDQVIGLDISDLIVYEGPTGLLRREIREQGRIRDFRYPFRTLSGKKRWALHDSYLVIEPRTGEECIQVIVKDITSIKLLEEELEAERERLSVTLRCIGDGVVSTDINARVVLLNKEGERLTGWMQHEAVGKPLSEVFNIVNEWTREKVVNPVDKVLAEGRTVGLANHTILISKDGTERAIADSGAPIFDPESRIVGVVLVFRDAEQERQSEAVRQRAERLESLGTLAGGIAHDFNNYLTGIMGNISLARMELGNGNTGNEIVGLLEDAEVSSRRARSLTDQLMTFARGGSPVKSSVELPELLKRCTEFSLSGSSVRLLLDLANNLWPLDADSGQLAQVVDNIVINAKQAMANNGVLRVAAANILLDVHNPFELPEGRYVRICFTDNGPGVPAKYQQCIFDPYFTTKQQGSGLGLATVHSIVTKHGGAIQLNSKMGQGATFCVCWPAAEHASVSDGQKAVAKNVQPGHGRRILVMDDMPGVGEMARKMLLSLGYESDYVENGEDAVSACQNALDTGTSYDAVILDLTVPGGMGGVDTLKALRKFWPEVRAIASSGYSTDPVMSDFEKYDFKGVIRKPYSIADLAHCVADVIAEHEKAGVNRID